MKFDLPLLELLEGGTPIAHPNIPPLTSVNTPLVVETAARAAPDPDLVHLPGSCQHTQTHTDGRP